MEQRLPTSRVGISKMADNPLVALEPSKHTGAARKGKAVEHLIAASCILASGGELNASTSLVDDEGVDIVFHRRGRSRTLAVQVKSRFDEEGGSKHLHEKGRFIGDVRAASFQPRDSLFLLFVAVRSQEADFGPIWLVPSHEFAARAQRVGGSSRQVLRMTASAKPATNDQWREFRLDKEELAPRATGGAASGATP
jgi:hypothetical protein